MKLLFAILIGLTATAETPSELLNQARAANTEEAYRNAIAGADKMVAANTTDAAALFQRGVARMELSGWFAQKAQYGAAQEVLAGAYCDLDKAVSMEPANYEFRKNRGMIYGSLPAMLQKTAAARDDLEAAIAHPNFAGDSTQARSYIQFLLGKTYVTLASPDQARVHFAAAVDLDPKSPAAAELEKLKAQPLAFDPKGRPMPDRFPKIATSVSPIMVAATVTNPDWANQQALPETITQIMEAMKGYPGLLGSHVLSSADQRGMVVILTWWKDKIAVNNWFYSDVHQGFIKAAYGPHKSNSGSVPSQVGIELFSVLPGGTQLNGSLTPEAILNSVNGK